MQDSQELTLSYPDIVEAISRNYIEISGVKVKYNLFQKYEYNWGNPEEWVRARTIAFLIISKNYPANRIKTEVPVPRRTPNDRADIVVYYDDRCNSPYLVIENKASGQSNNERKQGIEQLFGNANSLRAPLGLYDEWYESFFFDIGGFPPTERKVNRKGGRNALPEFYGEIPVYTLIAGSDTDIVPVSSAVLENKIRRSHYIIWSGGKRDPLFAFDEWSKLLLAKVVDERTTPTNSPRRFQVGTHETITAVANRVHDLFKRGCQDDTTIFDAQTRINLPDKKIFDVVRLLESVSLMGMDVDSIGNAFESFFGSIFRGELGQYFTMRQIARFVVALLEIEHEHYVIDPTAGSGGFLLEALLQVWHHIDSAFRGQPEDQVIRIKNDFALLRVYGIEIHDILSRICKINLLLHHDGHTNIEGDRSCLDSVFTKPRLQEWSGRFHRVIGNPPFGDDVNDGDEDMLGSNQLSNFSVANGRSKVPSEQAILERSIDFLEPGGKLGLVLPDGLLNNQGEQSNCPQVRAFLAKKGQIEAIVSLPDYAFRKSGAQNKTSILFFRRFTEDEKSLFDKLYEETAAEFGYDANEKPTVLEEESIISKIYTMQPFNQFKVFLAEANQIGYTPAGAISDLNDLYRKGVHKLIDDNQDGTILGEWRKFINNPETYEGRIAPDCISLHFHEMWSSHSSHRIDPKYHIFKQNENKHTPDGWVRTTIRDIMSRRESEITPSDAPDEIYKVMTISQTGEIRPREAGKGHNPPEWRGMYFDNSSSRWYRAYSGDVVYSSIDLWKGCIALVPEYFNGAIVTKEFPIYQIVDDRLDAEFLSYLLRSRYYQRAFRAITTGHSNRRRTQTGDFEALEVCFPPDKTLQQQLIKAMKDAREKQRKAISEIRQEMLSFSDIVDGRSDEELPEIELAQDDSD